MDALKSKLFPLAAALAAAIIFFLPFFASGGDRLSGDLGDNRLHLVILEHWHAVAAGQAAPLSPNFFAPAQGALAYSDALFLFVPPYLLLRALTQDPYLAYQLTLVTVKILGFLALFALLRRAAGLSPALAAWAAALFVLSNMYSAALSHGQLASAAFLPLILWLACLAWDLLPSRPLAAHAAHAAAAAVLALLFFTAYYVAFFFGLSLGLCLLIFLILEFRQPANRFPFRRALPLVASSSVVFALGLIPFLVTYLPLYRSAGGRPFELVQDQILSVSQIVSPGTANFAWGGIIENFGAIFQVRLLREIGRGWVPFTFIVFLIATFSLFRRPKPTPAHRLGAAACLTVLLLAIAATSLGGLQPWRIIHHFVPGAGGIRVPHRINLVLNLAVVFVLAVWFRDIFRNPNLRQDLTRRFTLAAVLFLLIVEQLNWNALPGFSRQADRALLGRVPPPPPSCRTFYISHSPRPVPSWKQIDAMLLARHFNLPTLNGYSGMDPQGWRCEDQEAACTLSLQKWAQEKNITAGLCALDLTTATWTPAATLAPTATLAQPPAPSATHTARAAQPPAQPAPLTKLLNLILNRHHLPISVQSAYTKSSTTRQVWEGQFPHPPPSHTPTYLATLSDPILCYPASVKLPRLLFLPAIILLGFLLPAPSQAAKKLPSKPTVAAKSTAKSSPKRKTAKAHTTSRRASQRRAAPRRATQQVPGEERTREIQEALTAKGYSVESTGVWGSQSVEALKKFQEDQNINNLSGRGKLDSLTLIALGLGPRREPPPASANPANQVPTEGKQPQ